MSDESELAYMAGFFDGEGSVAIVRRPADPKRGRRTSYALRASVYNNDSRPLEVFRKRFAGIIKSRAPRAAKHSASFIFEVNHAQAATMIRAIQPFCIIKRGRIDVALEFYACQQELPSRGKCGRNGLPQTYLDRASEYHRKLIVLNGKGPSHEV